MTLSDSTPIGATIIDRLSDRAADAPVDELARIAMAIRNLKRDLDIVLHEVTERLVHIVGEEPIEVEGVGMVSVRWSRSRTGWQLDDLVKTVIARAIDDPHTLFDTETGEILPPAVIAQNIGSTLRATIGMSYGKVTTLSELGIDADEFCTLGAWSPSVKLGS